MSSILIRTVIIYLLLSFSLRIMGKRQIGELDIMELVSTLLISELAAIPIDDPDIPLLNAVIPTLFLISTEIIISTLKNKSGKLKRAIEGSPTYIIYKGRLLQKELSENRISVNELLTELRTQGVTDISEVSYAILEQNGTLSVVQKKDGSPAHTLIIDGEILKLPLKRLGYDEGWVEKQLKAESLKLEEVFLMTVTDEGKLNFIKKEKKA